MIVGAAEDEHDDDDDSDDYDGYSDMGDDGESGHTEAKDDYWGADVRRRRWRRRPSLFESNQKTTFRFCRRRPQISPRSGFGHNAFDSDTSDDSDEEDITDERYRDGGRREEEADEAEGAEADEEDEDAKDESTETIEDRFIRVGSKRKLVDCIDDDFNQARKKRETLRKRLRSSLVTSRARLSSLRKKSMKKKRNEEDEKGRNPSLESSIYSSFSGYSAPYAPTATPFHSPSAHSLSPIGTLSFPFMLGEGNGGRTNFDRFNSQFFLSEKESK